MKMHYLVLLVVVAGLAVPRFIQGAESGSSSAVGVGVSNLTERTAAAGQHACPEEIFP